MSTITLCQLKTKINLRTKNRPECGGGAQLKSQNMGGEARQEDSKFKASLIYIVNVRPAWMAQ
jgi:hypothetical protein